MFLLLQVALLLHVTLTSGQSDNHNKTIHYKRFCYVTDWAHYRDSKVSFNPEDIGANLCTHLSLAFANLTDDGTNLKAGDPNDDPDLFTRFNRVKTHHPHLKTLLALGGWNFGSGPFSALVADDSKINQFATNAITFLRHRGFDGLDMDWEFPGDRGSPPADKHRFTKFIHALHVAFKAEGERTNRPKLLLTGAFGVTKARIQQSYEPFQLSKYFDLMNLMTYDMHGEWDKPMLTGHHSALYGTTADPHLNIDYLANYWASLNVPKEKLLIGLPFYARTMSLNDTTVTDVGSPYSGPGGAGNYTHHRGTLAYYEVCALLMNGVEKHLSNVQRAPYLVDGQRWVDYDDEKSLQEKDYVANYWASLNVPKEKLLIGLPFYARTLSLNDTTVKQIGSAFSGPGAAGNYTNTAGMLAYFEVCTLLMNGAETHLNNIERTPYLVDGQRWAGYDNERSLQEKVQYVIDHGFGGVMVWALDLDDFGGICGKKYPLMHAVKDAFPGIIG